jgi:hypothetical protein
MMPIIAQSLDYRFDVFLRSYDQELMFSEGGVSILSESLAALHMVDARKGVDAAICLVNAETNPRSAEFRYERRESLTVPTFRYLAGGGFRFD